VSQFVLKNCSISYLPTNKTAASFQNLDVSSCLLLPKQLMNMLMIASSPVCDIAYDS
jgi:hypothetical protein